MNICLFGSSSTELETIYCDKAYELGRLMGSHGHKLVFGGGEQGLMGACVRGLEASGGQAVGVAPKFFDIPGILHKSCERFIFTDTMRERKQIMEDLSDAFIVVPGGVGTYEEFFEIFTLRQLGRISKPIAVLNTEGYFDILISLLEQTVSKGFMRKENLELFGIFDDPEALLVYIESNREESGEINKLKPVSSAADQ